MKFRKVSLTALVPNANNFPEEAPESSIIADKGSVSNDSAREETNGRQYWRTFWFEVINPIYQTSGLIFVVHRITDHFTHRTLQNSDSAPEVVAPEFEPEKPKQNPEIDSEEHQDIVEDIN